MAFFKRDIVGLIKSKKPAELLVKQHLIYSIGLADYLPNRVLKGLISFTFSLLYPSGKLIITHKDKDKYKPLPPDWYCDWIFERRDVSDLIRLAEDAGISNYSIDIDWEDSNKIFFLIVTKRG